MIIDSVDVELIPGNGGADCPGNGKHIGKDGNLIECRCDECDYMICCFEELPKKICKTCTEYNCPLKSVD